MYQTIKYEVHDDHVATVTINRPDIMNTFNSQMVEEMAAVWEQIKLCLLYTSPSPRDRSLSRMPSSA